MLLFWSFWQLFRDVHSLFISAKYKDSVSPPEPSIHVTGIFLHIAGSLAKKTTHSPLLRHGRCPGDVLRVVMGRFAGQEYSFAVSWEYMALFCAL